MSTSSTNAPLSIARMTHDTSTAEDEAVTSDWEDAPTSLLELPPEIWSKICKLAVTYDKKIAVARSRDILYRLEKVSWCYFHEGCVEHRKKGGIWRVAPPAITRPCRLIRLETLPHFYKTNVFVIYGCGNVAERLKAWLDAIGQDNRALLRRFYYHPMRSHQGSLLDSLASNGWATQRGVVDANDIDILDPAESFLTDEKSFQRVLVHNI